MARAESLLCVEDKGEREPFVDQANFLFRTFPACFRSPWSVYLFRRFMHKSESSDYLGYPRQPQTIHARANGQSRVR